jgi:hypothetical protein
MYYFIYSFVLLVFSRYYLDAGNFDNHQDLQEADFE